jgi:RNA polymerase sigma factor (sigma-70 family)
MRHSRKLPVLAHYRALFEVGSFSGQSDGELLARFVNREGDSGQVAFTALVERHASKVLRICRSIVRNEHDAEDAFQATFLILATKADNLRATDSLGPWLSAVAKRVSRGARVVALARAARERRAAELAAAHISGSEGGGDVSSIVHEELDRLPDRYRLPLLLCDMESHTHQEAARQLGWPLGTVKSRQARARARLRARLIRRGLPGSLPLADPFGSGHFAIPERLIQSTAQAAVGLIGRGSSGRAISATVATLMTSFLRTTIVTRLTSLIGVVLLISAGVAATVLAQGQSERKKSSADSIPPSVTGQNPPAAAPVFEYEIRMWKDGAPITPTMKMRAHPGDLSEVKIPDGTLELRFRPRSDSGRSGGGPLHADQSIKRNLDKNTAAGSRPGLGGNGDELAARVEQAILQTELEIIKLESELKAREDEEKREMSEKKPSRNQQILDEFRKDPEVIFLSDEIALAADQRDRAKAMRRQGNDPARRMSEQRFKKLMEEYDALWEAKYEEIGKRLKTARALKEAQSSQSLRTQLKSLHDRKKRLTRSYEELKLEDQSRKTKK